MRGRLDFLIVGAMKSGTSSVAFHLAKNPSVAMPASEGHFFDQDKAYAKGVEWYLDSLAKHMTPETRVVGEKTPTYCYQPNVAARIHQHFPEVKLVWIFRNPIDRAYSNYLHARSNGFDPLTFEEAVAQEPVRIQKDIFHGYLARSRYHEQVQRFLDLFPKSQMHFMLFEDFVKDSAGELAGLCAFLGVPPDAHTHHEPRGVTIMPRWPASLVWARQTFGGRSVPLAVVKWLNTVGVAPGYPKLGPDLRAQLRAYFREDNAKLAAMIGRDLAVWDR